MKFIPTNEVMGIVLSSWSWHSRGSVVDQNWGSDRAGRFSLELRAMYDGGTPLTHITTAGQSKFGLLPRWFPRHSSNLPALTVSLGSAP